MRGQPLTLTQAVDSALRNYPSIKVSQEQINAAAAGIQLARTAYLPRIDTLAQINRATRNNVFGLLLPQPQSTIPSMSGPVIGSNNLGTAWGSAIGALVTWEPFDFGLRQASVAAAEASHAQYQATLKRTEFEVAAATADAWLTLAAAQETVKAAQAGVDRIQVTARIIDTLVTNELRPGADSSRAQAELAAARTQLIQAQQAVDIARANLSQFVGADPARINIGAAGLSRMPPETPPAPLDPGANPIAVEQNAVVEQARAQLHALERSYFPRFYLEGAAYARGTGAEVTGQNLGGLGGLAPNVQDYALGLTVTFPVMDRAALQARETAQSATVRAQAARAQHIATDLRAQWNAAVATLNGARRITANTPVQISAARAAAQQAEARYQSGLGNVEAVADAQRLLAQAEIDDALARLGVWRALLRVATAAGDIRPFIAEVGQ
jgi:outer membrane protein TolC